MPLPFPSRLIIVTVASNGWGQTWDFLSTNTTTPSWSSIDRPFDPVAARPRLDSMSSVEEDDYDTLTDIDSDKNVIRTKV